MKIKLALFALVALGLVACGGGKKDADAATDAADGAATAAPDVPADVPAAGTGGAPAAPAAGGGAPAP